MAEMAAVLAQWALDLRQVRDRMYRAPTSRERERWHALWLLTQGWSASKVAELLEREAHTIGAWLAALAEDGPAALAFEQTGGPPRPRGRGPGGAEGRGAPGVGEGEQWLPEHGDGPRFLTTPRANGGRSLQRRSAR